MNINRGTKVAYRAKTHIFLHPKGKRLEFRILIVFNSAWYETTVYQCDQTCILRKNAFLYAT